MYLASIILLLGALPVASILVEWLSAHGAADIWLLIGKWFVFWAVGVRLAMAGVRQVFNPSFTAETIFELKDLGALKIVQELGIANFSMGLLGLLSLAMPLWTVPAAFVGGLFYGLAGIKHLTNRGRNTLQNIAMITDLWIFVVLAFYLAAYVLRSQ
jgi:hypothetical protein